MIVTNYAEWSGRLPDLATHALAIIAVPLLTQDRILGVLTISDQAGSRQFTEDDVQTLVLFAQQAAAVLAEQLSRRQAEALVLYEERARLARDLHDGLAQDLASLLMRAELCQALAGDAEDDLRANLEIISVGLQRAIREARSTILALRASTPTACDLEADVRNLAAAFAAQTHMPVQVEAIGADCGRLAELQRLALLDAVREALWNVQKHARASLVQLRLTWDGDACVRVLVNDDGVGFDPRALAAPGVADTLHFGLTMRQERLAAFGGTLRVHSAPGKGTVVEASLPIVHDG